MKNPFTEQTTAPNKQKELPTGFFYGNDGLNYKDPNNDDAFPVWICSKLTVKGSTRDIHNENWGRILEFRDIENHAKRWVMPMELLTGRQEALHSTLLNMGLNLSTSTKAKNLLADFISRCTVELQHYSDTKINYLLLDG